MTATLIHRETDILDRAIGASLGAWPTEIATAFLGIKLSPLDVARMNELAEKAREGTLGDDEELEIESYLSAARLLEILKLRARASLMANQVAPKLP